MPLIFLLTQEIRITDLTLDLFPTQKSLIIGNVKYHYDFFNQNHKRILLCERPISKLFLTRRY